MLFRKFHVYSEGLFALRGRQQRVVLGAVRLMAYPERAFGAQTTANGSAHEKSTAHACADSWFVYCSHTGA